MRKLIPFLGLLFLLGCESSEETDQGKTVNYSIEIVDSLQIDYFGDLSIIDHDSISHEYLAVTRNDQILWFIVTRGDSESTINIPF